MCKTKKRIRRLVALGLCLMMLVSTGLMASAATYPYTFSFNLGEGGDKGQVTARNKTNYNSYACIDFSTCNNPSNFSLIYRLRSGTNNTEASELYYLTGTGNRYPAYNSGYGQYNKPYYFRIQTSSSSGFGAYVAGSWMP
ncbi:MAG: hypothetical protein HFI42_11285 [Lachnospiraceae bacterium]|nr:hypothetical protein [Lachnospiraceae bacterium]